MHDCHHGDLSACFNLNAGLSEKGLPIVAKAAFGDSGMKGGSSIDVCVWASWLDGLATVGSHVVGNNLVLATGCIHFGFGLISGFVVAPGHSVVCDSVCVG